MCFYKNNEVIKWITTSFVRQTLKKNAAGRPIVALDYGCGADEIVTNLKEMEIDASGCVVF